MPIHSSPEPRRSAASACCSSKGRGGSGRLGARCSGVSGEGIGGRRGESAGAPSDTCSARTPAGHSEDTLPRIPPEHPTHSHSAPLLEDASRTAHDTFWALPGHAQDAFRTPRRCLSDAPNTFTPILSQDTGRRPLVPGHPKDTPHVGASPATSIFPEHWHLALTSYLSVLKNNDYHSFECSGKRRKFCIRLNEEFLEPSLN